MRGSGLGLPLVIAAAWLAAVGLFELLRPGGCAVSLCLFRNVTEWPCPTCGSTRAARALFAGRPIEALRQNPLAVTTMAAGGAWLLLRATGAAPRAPRRRGGERRGGSGVIAVAILLVLANWCYLLVRDDAVSSLPWR